MTRAQVAQAHVARALANLPAARRWHAQPLNPSLRHLLEQIDDQTLLSVAAQAMLNVQQHEQKRRRRQPGRSTRPHRQMTP